jgi:hypothetical protein
MPRASTCFVGIFLANPTCVSPCKIEFCETCNGRLGTGSIIPLWCEPRHLPCRGCGPDRLEPASKEHGPHRSQPSWLPPPANWRARQLPSQTMNGLTGKAALDVEGLRERNVSLQTNNDAVARKAVLHLNALEEKAEKKDKDRKTFGRTPDGIGKEIEE